jgi:hypothetical protein
MTDMTLMPGIVGALSGAVAGWLLKVGSDRWNDRKKSHDETQRFAKMVALPLLELARDVVRHSRMLNDGLGANEDRLRALYKFVPAFVDGIELEEFQDKVKQGSTCPHDVLVALRDARNGIASASDRYEQIRQTVEFVPDLRNDSEALRLLVAGARDATRTALVTLLDVSPTDTKSAISLVLQEFRDGSL